MVIESGMGLAPLPLVRLVADREIESIETTLDRTAQQSMKVSRPGTEARPFPAAVAREHMVIAAAQHQSEIGGDNFRADLQPADVDEFAQPGIGGNLEKEFAASRRREQIGDAHFRQGSRLLLDERIHGALDLFRALHLDPPYFTVFGEPPKLRAVAPARRR